MSETPVILGPDSKPLARAKPDTKCPQCRAEDSKRVLSGGFGAPHDVCGQCGYDFQERTL